MRHGRQTTATVAARALSALLALLSLAPVGLLRPAPSPCTGAPGAAVAADQAGAGCGGCCESDASAPAPASISCGCCGSERLPEPAVPPSPVTPLAAPSSGALVVLPPVRAAHRVDRLPSRSEAAPPARLLHCVHLI